MEVALIIRWVLVLAGLTVLGAPLAAAVFRHLPRQGAPFSLPVTVVCWTTVVFLLGQFTFGYHTLVVGLLVVAGLSGLSYYCGHVPSWRAVATSYGVFLAGFGLYVLYAAHNAGITPLGGEQFLHYGLTNSLVHAERLPPEDFWFAGKEMRYYYGTQLQVALLSMVNGTELRFGYYLGLSTFYGMLFVSAYGLGGAIVAARDRSYHLGGVLGACFTAVGGTLVTTARLGFRQLPRDTAAEYGRPVYAGLLEERGMSMTEAYQQGAVSEWFWFYDRYVIEGALNEFPFYSFIKADLHGHSLSTGYIVLAAAVAFSYYQTPTEHRLRRVGIVYGGLGLVAGLFGFMNTWSLPTAVGLAWLAIAAADAHPGTLLPARASNRLVVTDEREGLYRLGGELWRVVLATLLAIPVAVIGVAIASPFLVFNSIPTNDGIGLFPPQTSLASFLVMYGGVLAIFLCSLAVAARSQRRLSVDHLMAGIAILVLSAGWYILGFGAVGAVLVPVLLVAWWAVRTDRGDFSLVLLIGGFGLLLAMELVHAKVYPFNRVRWNTTLKVAVQGWTVAAVGAGAASALLLSRAGERLAALNSARKIAETETNHISTPVSAVPALLTIALVCVVVLSSLPFAGLAFYHNVGDDVLSPGEGSIDGLATHDQWKGDEMQALYWLQEKDQPTIVEAPARRSYQWKSVASVFTDAVTVVGWDHQEGYRGADAFDERATAVATLYAGTDSDVKEIVQQYDVEYIYVGPAERDTYDSITDFETIAGIEPAFENEAVTIYKVSEELRT